MPCKSCRGKTLTRDDDTGRLICQSCGVVQSTDDLDARPAWNPDGPNGSLVRLGTSGTGGSLAYKEKKIYEATKLIDELCVRLNLSGSKPAKLRAMVCEVTEGELGAGDWFPVLIGACAYVVMRQEEKPLPIGEVGSAVQCGVYEMGRMVSRVVKFLGLRLPEFDLVECFERVVRNFSGFEGVARDRVRRIREQGIFLVNCAVKWFLTTGRRPLQVVVAVLVFVAGVNGVDGASIEKVAKEVGVPVSTCTKRYKELVERLVEAARVLLPWGEDVTARNVVKNGAFLLKFMELKSMAEKGREGNKAKDVDLEKLIEGCLKKDELYCYERAGENDLRYFGPAGDPVGVYYLDGDVDRLQLSPECLSLVYNEYSKRAEGNMGQLEKVNHQEKRRSLSFELQMEDWWNGKSALSKKMLLKQLLEKDVGLDVLPPSFVNGCNAKARRRMKIEAAKKRIDKIMRPECSATEDLCLLEGSEVKKRKRKREVREFDWEDFIIETLLLHQVKEEQIETGHYNTLLDLHVFNSGIVQKHHMKLNIR